MLAGGGHIAQVGAAIAQGQAQGLAFPHSHVGAAVSGRLHDGQGDGVAAHDVHGARLVDQLAQGLGVFQLAVEVGLLEIERGHIGGEHLPEGFRVRLAVFGGNQTHFIAGAVAVGGNGVDHIGMGRGGHQGDPALPIPAHGGSFGGGSGPVIHRGVGHVHAGQLADHGLILKNGLEEALAHLRLIGRVSGEEFLLGGDVLDDAGDVVIISASTPQNGGKYLVFRRHGLKGPAHFQFAHTGGDVQRAVQVHGLRNILVQLPEIPEANGLQHFLPVRQVCSFPWIKPQRRRLRSRWRPAALLYR